MPVITTLAACNTNPALNGPLGTDLPSTLDDAVRYALSFIAQLRDGAGVQAGAVFMFPTATAPLGYVKLNGALLSRTTYATLFAFASGTGLLSEADWANNQQARFSVGDGSTTFRIPDLRGVFMRGLDEARGLDSGRAIGSFQDHANVSHTHGISDPGHAHTVSDPGHIHSASADVQGVHAHTYQAAIMGPFTAGGAAQVAQAGAAATSLDGGHGHNISIGINGTSIAIVGAFTGISAAAQGGVDGHPRNYAYPFFMKF
jgi:microcystin-dependent protein